MRNRLLLLPAFVLLLAACSSERSTNGSTAATSTDPGVTTSIAAPTTDDTDTTAPPTTTGTDTTASTVAPTTPATPPPATTAPCPAVGDTATKTSADPVAMSSLVGADIRVGDHPCYERVVIELSGSGDFPGWSAEYVDDPVYLGESDETVEIDGDATLLVRMGTWMPTMEGDGYSGPTDIFPTTVDHIVELRQTENWEGYSIWAIGLDDEYPFTVTVLHSPERLVIDLQVAE